ncbi:HMG (high mobility group) box domain containing protein [Acanthamoeba castellanii str. Neff]|uniref:HMG (High mobility group) box domain containing protein n=1 Tax=Acanthamoeba castellanii (strain ATCC 30010 / Neff) TaxID=1257118 RepID=L8HKZ9_ACACF|nr:HMG (high mobility group) box domain containing protein [Acanthamoeba castellanii str. Neff]ELR25348.1 HMG (high mobility group) box domain containing protein [Acanthamoeba castellanii str. Neff]
MPRRKRKDPNAPKRAMTAYMLFSQEKRTQIKTDHPTVGFGQVGKLLGEAWAALPDGDKRKYNELAAKDKIRYQKEAAQYKEDHPESSDEEERPAKKRKKKDPNAPKKPCSAFFHFSKKMRPRIKDENPDASFGQLGKIIGEQWSKLGADERKEFETLAAADKERYAKEMKDYQAKKDSSSDSDSSDSSDSDSSSGSSGSSDSDSD